MTVVITEKILKILIWVFQIIVRTYIKLKINLKPTPKLPSISNPILLLSASDLVKKILNQELTSKEVVKVYIERLKETNKSLNFLVDERFEEAIVEANKVDDFLKVTETSREEIAQKKPLLGIPCTIKEALAVKGLKHTVGLYSRKEIIAEEDSDAVEQLRRSGAIIVAVTNTPEACCWWETFNPLYGRTNNPYNTTCTAGGSSGGEGAAIASGGSLIGIGSDFGGSIRIPACFNGIFGHRPSSLSTSLKGHHPIPKNDDLKTLLVTGPLARYAKDLRTILKVITKPSCDLKLDLPVDLKKTKFYYLNEEPEYFLATPAQPEVKEAIKKTIAHFKSIGATVEGISMPKMKYAVLYWYAKLKTDDGPQIGKELANHKGRVSIIIEFLKSFFEASKHTFPVLLFGILEEANGVPYKGSVHSTLLNDFEELLSQFKNTLGDNGVFILPTHPTSAPPHYDAIATPFDNGYTAVFNALGLPATQCPVGFDSKKLPLGVQMVANINQDRLTLAAAEEMERAFGGWIPPC